MKARASSLNPYATSYVPLSRRGPTDEGKGHESNTILVTDSSKIRNHGGWLAYDPGSSNDAESLDNNSISLKIKNHSVFGSSSSSTSTSSHSHNSAEVAGKQAMDIVDHDMNLAYLQMIFPGVSDESLSSVYTANGADMEATVEMLNQLEVHSGDFSENLPESLDIGDVSEAGSSGSQKLKKVAAAAGEGSW